MNYILLLKELVKHWSSSGSCTNNVYAQTQRPGSTIMNMVVVFPGSNDNKYDDVSLCLL